MMPPEQHRRGAIELIANRVAAALKEELAEIAAQLAARDERGVTLTVE